MWFLQLLPQLEGNGNSVSPRRLDQHLYPYYKKDVEAGRLTDRPIEPDEYEKEALNARLRLLARHLREKWVVSLVVFQLDERKAGGAYVTRTGMVKKLYETERFLTLTDGTVIPLDDLIALEGEEFAAYGL